LFYIKPPAPLPARRAYRPEDRAYAPEGHAKKITAGIWEIFLVREMCFKMVYIESISKIRLGFIARREVVRKRSIHVVCEHFEPLRNTAMGT
jgi:hypothetical protein